MLLPDIEDVSIYVNGRLVSSEETTEIMAEHIEEDGYADKSQLTKNFKLEEFLIRNGYPSIPVADLNQRTFDQIQIMANMLQVIRDEIGKPIKITSGVRMQEDYDRLLRKGDKPSETSDHYYGNIIPYAKESKAYKKYGANYALAVGAVDIVCLGMDTIELYNSILKMRYDGKIKTGQLLLEKDGTFWVHIANDPSPWLDDAQKKQRGSWSINGVGYSLNNGNDFEPIKIGPFAPMGLFSVIAFAQPQDIFTNPRDSKKYKTVKIGEQLWMAENLSYNVSGSVCYDNKPENCDKYGRLYNWSTAGKVCLSGWHLPTNAEWDRLCRFVDGTKGTDTPYNSSTAGNYLKAKSDWGSGSSGLDSYGFAALPGGYGNSDASDISEKQKEHKCFIIGICLKYNINYFNFFFVMGSYYETK
jgi:uncharacterized protein (TIGR02145 family)